MKNYMLPDDCAVLYKLVKLWKKKSLYKAAFKSEYES